MQWNIGIDTLIPYNELPAELKALRDNYTFDDLLHKKIDLSVLDKYNVTMAANFEFYRKDKMSFFSEIKRELYNNRKAVKREMLDAEAKQQNVSGKEKKELEYLEAKLNNMQLGLKVLLNGGYGALASPYFLYYMVENAEAITLSGQFVNKWTSSSVEDHLQKVFENKKGHYWIAGDTDSGYFTIKPFMDTVKEKDIQKKVDVANQFCEQIMKPHIDQKCQELCDYINGYEQKMVWGREVIAENAIWVAKKKYVMQVWDSEYVRYKTPKIKLTGMEAVKSSYPEWSRNYLKKCYTAALQGTESDVHTLIEPVSYTH
jgi:DNA polymerase elongation subunit (family B)